MSLTEAIGGAGLAVYAEAALILFFAAFVAVAIQVMRKIETKALDERSQLPFGQDDEIITARGTPEAKRDV
ncbi:MAG TPA: hypothetical protein VHE30_22505 [Polyangiaceae bacterium]|nr:hypothetical protein [Polyangiaceae bacterium]